MSNSGRGLGRWIRQQSGVHLTVGVDIKASPERIWSELVDFASHTEWMKDAYAIRFGNEQREGVGVVLLIETRVGPLRATDRFEITEVEYLKTVAGRHAGLFQGTGRFELSETKPGLCRLRWQEQIRFPLRFGGPFGARVGRLVFARIWSGNLKALKQRIEQ